MSRRSSNTVKLLRRRAAYHGTVLDRNGIPVLDDPRHANRLPKPCVGSHRYWRVGRRFKGIDGMNRDVFEVEFRCVACGSSATETEVE